MDNVSVFCFLASYVVALALEWFRLVRRSAVNRAAIIVFALAGLLAHTWYLYNRSTETSLPPLLSSTHDWMLVLAWLSVLFYIVLTTVDRSLAVGLFLLPVVLLLIGAAYFASSDTSTLLAERDPAKAAVRNWAMLHATLLVFGIAAVALGFVLSVMYVYQHRRLKRHRTMSGGLKLPSLERLARFNWWAIVLAVPLLTLGMLTGVGLGLWVESGEVAFSFGDPVVIVSGLMWAVMIVFFGWLLGANHPAGKQVAWRTIWAFGFLLFTLIGMQVLTDGGLFPSWHGAGAEKATKGATSTSGITSTGWPGRCSRTCWASSPSRSNDYDVDDRRTAKRVAARASGAPGNQALPGYAAFSKLQLRERDSRIHRDQAELRGQCVRNRAWEGGESFGMALAVGVPSLRGKKSCTA